MVSRVGPFLDVYNSTKGGGSDLTPSFGAVLDLSQLIFLWSSSLPFRAGYQQSIPGHGFLRHLVDYSNRRLGHRLNLA